jgi:hypothetical protein
VPGKDVLITGAAWGIGAEPQLLEQPPNSSAHSTSGSRSVAVPHLCDSRGYALIVASPASLIPLRGGAAYGASKAGVTARQIGKDLAQLDREQQALGAIWR